MPIDSTLSRASGMAEERALRQSRMVEPVVMMSSTSRICGEEDARRRAAVVARNVSATLVARAAALRRVWVEWRRGRVRSDVLVAILVARLSPRAIYSD